MIEVDFERIYGAWRSYLLANSQAKHFGVIFDPSKQAVFPYANLTFVGRSTGGVDLEGDELSINLTFDCEAFINNNKYMVLYDIDHASAEFFLELGFRRIGDSQIIRVSNTVTRILSRFTLTNYTGSFLYELPSQQTGNTTNNQTGSAEPSASDGTSGT